MHNIDETGGVVGGIPESIGYHTLKIHQINYVFKILVLIVHKPNSLNDFWSAAGACIHVSLVYFTKYS